MASQVDILIATIGRPTLYTAIYAALVQVHENCRAAVVADGKCPEARRIFDHIAGSDSAWAARMVYLETPERYGHGNTVKEWYINHGPAREWIKFLDDDDWLSPLCIAEFARHIRADTAVAACEMVVVKSDYKKTRCIAHRICPGELKPNMIGCGNMMVRRDAARGVSFPLTAHCSDYEWARAVCKRGGFVSVPFPLYYYNGYRGCHERPTPRSNAI